MPTYDVSVNDMVYVYSHWHCKARWNVGFEVLQEIIVKNDIFWGVTPYGLERAASISSTEENFVPLKHEHVSTRQYGGNPINQ